ncbi:MAG: DUF4396 domain-containing protein [Halofilum sp. (in: g-proteobacteria)]|nr:DUF4396 domain-containing protein [Halofilum sp. (in: g-proteobacteria)]
MQGETIPGSHHSRARAATSGAAGHGSSRRERAITTAHATLHCLIGCSIGEFLGLAIGVTLGLGVWATMGLATALAFVFGLNLAAWPVMKRHGFSWRRAMATVWLAEVISISVMEIAMNGADYWVGGVQVTSMADPLFWIGFGVAVVAGFVAAYPANWWLLARNLKHCH